MTIDYKDKFKNYVSEFNLENKKIYYKYLHSYRVLEEMDYLSKELNLNPEDKYLASIIGLYHDLGRFTQLKNYDTYNDFASIDHAKESVRVLFEEDFISTLDVKQEWYDIIKIAIFNHNKFKIQEGLDERTIFFSKLIRDADKLDILFSFSNDRVLEIEEDDGEIRKDLVTSFFEHRQIELGKEINKNELVVVHLGFIFDLYFDCSFKKIYENNYINKMFEGIKNKELFKPYFDEANKYIEEKLFHK